MTHPVSRVLALLELLQARPGLTAVQLAERLEVDERTVRRYVDRLADLGIPVEAARGRYGGYRLLPGYRLPPLMLTGDEAVAVVLGLLTAHGEALLPVEQAAASAALAKIQRVLPPDLRDRVAALARGVEVAGSGARASDPAVLVALAEAAGRQRRVRLAYRSSKGAESERELDPYGLVLHPPRWYVTGLDHRSGELRVFRLDRIVSVEPGEQPFTPPPGFDAVAHVRRTLATAPYAHEVEVLLHTTLEQARSRIPSATVTLSETEHGTVRLRTRVERLDGTAALLASLGWPFTVVRPDGLRAEVRALARRLDQWTD